MFKVETAVSANIRLMVLQHLRSFLDLGELNTEEIEVLEFTVVEIAAFSTKYSFIVVHRVEDSGVASSSLIALDKVAKVKPCVRRTIISGHVTEILEPNAQFPRFEETFKIEKREVHDVE